LIHQKLTSKTARDSIKAELAQAPFKNSEMVSGWRLIQDAIKPARVADPAHWLVRLLNALVQTANVFAHSLSVLLWTAAILAVGIVLWRYRAWLDTFVGNRRREVPVQREVPEQLFGLQVNAESLPDDVATAAEQLWSSHPREALGLLYRALLSRLLLDYQLPLKNADTEGEVLQQVTQLKVQPLTEFSQNLTTHWQNLAYGHRLPEAQLQQALCQGWRQLFDSRTTP
jgi:hypothetical protein